MTVLSEDAHGVYVIAATPFDSAFAVDERSIATMVDFYLAKGADGLTILGMMGEAPKLTPVESLGVVKSVLACASGRPVIVGVSAPGFAAIAELSRDSMALGAAGVMVAPPSSLRTDDQIVEYYQQVADLLGPKIPIVLQDFPLSTGVAISVSAIDRIVRTIPSLVMIKHEDWPGLGKLSTLRQQEDAGRRRVSVLCGNSGLFLPEEMQRGADGAMTGFAYPEMMIDVVRLSRLGEHERARDVFDAYLPLIRYEQQPGVGLAVRKYILAKRGVIAGATQRKPGATLPPKAVAEVEALIARQARRLQELN
ncbi:dihydrodipicolinate synthase family protein [Phenylobacterium sp.]|uniref:dihydrodipicolinate synthase family protein n=1 Tax=Phenylobacterium sp. TaxID=1871053 RepID=UPI00262EDF29|nr:dihydrodipicolinate synthase family protein [Phenylobacterium sp.]